MSAKMMKVTLRREKVVISSVSLLQGCEAVLVGRARECALRVPADDHSASGVHARIFWKGSSLMIEDAGSRNGVYHNGKLLKSSAKMTPGALYAVGGCLLSVENVAKDKEKKVRDYHRLEHLNGENAGRIQDIKPHSDGKEFDIGLDPACSVHLNDMLVSRRHAVLRVRDDGECWIEDLGSRNGTFINGERLVGKERLVKDGDKISIAFFDFRFLDRKVAHTHMQAWLKLGVISVTVCVMAALYIGWTASRQAVENYLMVAREAAAHGDFDQAWQVIDESRNARDADKYSVQINGLASEIEVWKKSASDWSYVQSEIAAKNLTRARRKLDDLASAPIEAWAWNPENAATVKTDIDFATQALRLYFDGKDVIDAASKDIKADADLPVRAALGPIESFLRDNADLTMDREYMKPVFELMENLLNDLRVIRAGYDAIDASIARISAKDTDFKRIYADFNKIAMEEAYPAAVRGYARQQLPPCGAFVAAQEFLENELALLLNLDFVGVRRIDADFKLPNQDLCIRHVKYSDARAAFAERHRLIQHESSALQLMIEGLKSAGVTDDSRGECIDCFLNPTNIAKALEFDCMQRRPPNVRRPEPAGLYDSMFGIEYTFESLRSLPNVFNGRNIRTAMFTPKCVAARKAFDGAETFIQYLDNPARAYLQRGAVGKYYTQCMRITIEREKMVQFFKDVKGSPRAELVAGFYADFFSSDPSEVAKRELSVKFGKLKREIISLGEDYMLETDPEKQLAIREEILSKGIPGDPALHSKWAQKYD